MPLRPSLRGCSLFHLPDTSIGDCVLLRDSGVRIGTAAFASGAIWLILAGLIVSQNHDGTSGSSETP